MRDNTVNPWRRCSWMEHRIAIPACLFFFIFMKVPYTSHRRTILFYPIKWQHAWNIDIMQKEKTPWEMEESLHSSLQFSTAGTIPQRTVNIFLSGEISPLFSIKNKIKLNVIRDVVLNKHWMFIGPCIIVIVEELETNLMSLIMFITLNICSTCFEH